MAFTFHADWDAEGNHKSDVAGLKTADDVESAVSSACAGHSSTDPNVRGVLTACAAKASRVTVLKGVHQAEDVGLVGATYHITVSLPLGRGHKTYHVYFGVTSMQRARPKGTSQSKWRSLPSEQRMYRTFSLLEVSYFWNGVRQAPALT